MATYINNIGQILESKGGKLRVELNGAAMKDLVAEIKGFYEANYGDMNLDAVTKLDRDKEFKNLTLFLGDPHENAPDFVKGNLFIVKES
jgi:hypothetical protein